MKTDGEEKEDDIEVEKVRKALRETKSALAKLKYLFLFNFF